jgi:hypothetical protein
MQILDVLDELKLLYKNQLGYPHARVPGLTEVDVQRWNTMLGGSRPPLFWDVHLDFDEGEYYHGNNRDEDPVDVKPVP